MNLLGDDFRKCLRILCVGWFGSEYMYSCQSARLENLPGFLREGGPRIPRSLLCVFMSPGKYRKIVDSAEFASGHCLRALRVRQSLAEDRCDTSAENRS